MEYEPVPQRFPNDSLIENIERNQAGLEMLCKILTVYLLQATDIITPELKSVTVQQGPHMLPNRFL
jgi:hypothetical protein